MALDPHPVHRARPIARRTPIGTAIRTSAVASFRLWTSAFLSVGSFQTESTGSPQYQRSEALPDGAGARRVERELHSDEHRDERPEDVGPGDDEEARTSQCS